MDNAFLKELMQIEKKEKKILNTVSLHIPFRDSIYEKVPKGLSKTLEMAFTKAFKMVFLEGTKVIEKTFDKESTSLSFDAGDFVVNKAQSKKSIHRLDKTAHKGDLLNHTATTAAGFGMGLLGLGLPDIFLLVSTLLKGIYEIALGYGFTYEEDKEKIYILRLICTALSDSKKKQEFNQKLELKSDAQDLMDEEIRITAKVLSDSLLVEKFVQGIPIVGVVGGFVNHAVYKKTSALAQIKYKKRYLLQKLVQLN